MTPQTPAGSVVQAAAAGAAAGAASSPTLVIILLTFALLAIGFSIVANVVVFGNRRRIEHFERRVIEQNDRITEEMAKRDRLFEQEFQARRDSDDRTARAIEGLTHNLKCYSDLVVVIVRGHMEKKDVS
ncbi:hypothetical protein [Asaia bogorensis]|uniref:hypothetical protein n=1 Tax=Asaia bogorensis TaxID=91915 RepID=UPI000EFBC39B|nr:hypothetical protein [Asaia bogorensis]